jgi:hypothetical protein
MTKVLSGVADCGEFEVLQFQFDAYILGVVSGSAAISMQQQVSATHCLELRSWTPRYWRWHHAHLLDICRQLGAPDPGFWEQRHSRQASRSAQHQQPGQKPEGEKKRQAAKPTRPMKVFFWNAKVLTVGPPRGRSPGNCVTESTQAKLAASGSVQSGTTTIGNCAFMFGASGCAHGHCTSAFQHSIVHKMASI